MADVKAMDGDVIGLNVDVLIVRGGKVLLGQFSDKWKDETGKKYWGVPGRDLKKDETFGDAVRRYVKEEIGCEVSRYVVFAVNANHALGNHFIGVGAYAEIEGEPKNAKTEDWDKWEWFDLNDLPLNIFPPAWNVIKSFREKKVCVSE